MRADAVAAFRAELDAELSGKSPDDQKYLFLGILTKHLKGTRPVLVGGSLVQFYSLGAIMSADLDLVADRALVEPFLLSAGFVRDGRYFERPGLAILVEFPGETIRPSETVEPLRFGKYTLYGVTVEDAVVDRIVAAKWWDSREDWRRALVIARAQRSRIDWERLVERARANDSADKAEELRRIVEAA